MQVCPSCQHQQFDGIMFCDVCGESLLGLAIHVPSAPLQLSATMPVAPRLEWYLHIRETDRRVLLPHAAQLLIGRGKSALDGINLDPEGAPAGVSSKHAVLLFTDAGWTLQDLGSTNGTYVNGARLAVELPVALSAGDRIHFGALRTKLKTLPARNSSDARAPASSLLPRQGAAGGEFEPA